MVASQTLESKVAYGAVWTLLEKSSAQLVGFVVSMVLARLLTPDDYGTIALTTIFFAIAGVFVDGGFGNALIQKKTADEVDFNSVFYLNLFLSIIAYLAFFLAAPLIADFYRIVELKAIVRVSALCFFFNALNGVQNAELTKKMLFHLSFRVSLLACFSSAVCGVTLAILGYGVWSLVWASLMSGLVGTIARWFIIAWRPRLLFDFSRLRPLFSFGWKMAASSMIDQFFAHINGLLIGRYYSRVDLAYVNRGITLPQLAMGQVDETLGRVAFPALVLMQDDRIKLRNTMRRMMQCSTFLVLPFMAGIAVCSHSLLRLLYGPQWTPAAPYMMLACFSFALWPFHTINLRGIMAMGRSDVFLKLEVLKKVLKLIVILLALRHGVFVFMLVSAFALGPMGVMINAWPNRKLLGYTICMQLKDVMPSAMVCILEMAVVWGIGLICNVCSQNLGVSDDGGWFMCFLCCKLSLQFILGAATFFSVSYIFRLKPMMEYARIGSGIMKARCPTVANKLERIFAI